MADDTDPEVSASHQDPEKLVRSDVLPVANDPPVGVGDDGIPPVEGRLRGEGAHLGAQVDDPVAFAFEASVGVDARTSATKSSSGVSTS